MDVNISGLGPSSSCERSGALFVMLMQSHLNSTHMVQAVRSRVCHAVSCCHSAESFLPCHIVIGPSINSGVSLPHAKQDTQKKKRITHQHLELVNKGIPCFRGEGVFFHPYLIRASGFILPVRAFGPHFRWPDVHAMEIWGSASSHIGLAGSRWGSASWAIDVGGSETLGGSFSDAAEYE